MASRMKIPTLIHEQNAFPGITNRILSRFVDAVAVSFKESEKYFKPAGRLVCTGNPVRAEIIEAGRQAVKARTGKNRQKPTVVVVGGSLGAEKLNDTVVKMIKNLYSPDDFNLIFATGNSQYERISSELRETRIDTLSVVPYIYDAAHTYASADIMVCRAGAITCSEVTVLGVPTIMIPSPNVSANHQEYNARSLERAGASVVILEKNLDHQLLYRQIMELLNDRGKLDGMARNAKKIGIADAVEKIYSIASELIKSRI
jgi:UDP-N-acetylglucosamine--N-acetylmuramyl-(pentapeptide) pyrophosphoryl-undecaprenol N-acetylglucosamine transferase